MKKRSPLLFTLLLSLLLGACSSRPKMVVLPLEQSTEERLKEVEIAGDSTSIQLAFDCPSDSLRSPSVRQLSYNQGENPTAPRIEWHVVRDTITLTAKTPKQVVHTVEKVITKEIPREVKVVREVNRLSWWQTTLLWVGGCSLLAIGLWLVLKLQRLIAKP